jgi:ferredoxin
MVIEKDKKRCVRCGRCLAVCPFYRITRREEFSPRGRVVMTEAYGTPDTVRCFACLKCALSCPYELSPLDRPGQRFPGDQRPATAALFAFIYHDTPVPPEYATDPQVRSWLAARGAISDEAALRDAARFVSGELFHPFLQIEVPLQ